MQPTQQPALDEFLSTVDAIAGGDHSPDTLQKMCVLCSPDYEPTREDKVRLGGEAIVLKVSNTVLDRAEVLKIPRRALVENKRLLARYFRGMQLQSRVHRYVRAGVPEVYAARYNAPFVSMEWIRGLALLRFLEQAGQRESARFFVSILDLVASLHDRMVIHRDLTPSNILVGVDPVTEALCPYLLDFGLAKRVQGESTLTGIGAKLGTNGWASPDQLDDAARADFLDDVYTAGRLLYVMATYATTKACPRKDRDYDERLLPGEWLPIFQAATAPREARYQSIRELRAAVARVVGIEDVSIVRVPDPISVFSEDLRSTRKIRKVSPPPESTEGDDLVDLFVKAVRSAIYNS